MLYAVSECERNPEFALLVQQKLDAYKADDHTMGQVSSSLRELMCLFISCKYSHFMHAEDRDIRHSMVVSTMSYCHCKHSVDPDNELSYSTPTLCYCYCKDILIKGHILYSLPGSWQGAFTTGNS